MWSSLLGGTLERQLTQQYSRRVRSQEAMIGICAAVVDCRNDKVTDRWEISTAIESFNPEGVFPWVGAKLAGRGCENGRGRDVS